MITRLEIDGFKTFENFAIDLRPFSAVVGPNASGKSNLFDALKFLSLLAEHDVHSAMQQLRGEPQELFRATPVRTFDKMSFAVEVFLPLAGIDPFGAIYHVKSQRLRYELRLSMRYTPSGVPTGILVENESCRQINKKDDKISFYSKNKIRYSFRKNAFMDMDVTGKVPAIQIRQDGESESGTSKRGRGRKLAAGEATRTALSTVNTAEFPHLYALRTVLQNIRFLEINPAAARGANDRFEDSKLRSDASNLSSVLAHLKEITAEDDRPEGAIADISVDLASLIGAVKRVNVDADEYAREYSYSITTKDGMEFSSRLISDGTLRLLALLAVLDDPFRSGTLCFEEPENGVHEGRIRQLIEMLREAAEIESHTFDPFQIIINTHSPAVLSALREEEIIAADLITSVEPKMRRPIHRTRMRTGVRDSEFDLDQENMLTRAEIQRILKRPEWQV